MQNLSNGETSVIDVPCPKCPDGFVLIKSFNSLISLGTEKMLVDFGKSNFLNKARKQPDKLKMVLDKVKTDGLITTYDAVKSKLDQPAPLGYCNAGVVIESKAEGLSKGDRVISNGPHAEVVCVPKNLCVKIPENVDSQSASFTVLASVALQGVRLAHPTIGEAFVVFGLGLVGQITTQILVANGCRVLGIDTNTERCKKAALLGAETIDLSEKQDLVPISQIFSRGFGVDGVIITASSSSNDIIHQSAMMCRKRARIVLVGVVGLNLRRDDFYEKELTFQVSSSYGPGRYDKAYEEKGQDYPFGFVRWTERRNFEAILEMMSKGSLDVRSLISHEYEFKNAKEAYLHLNNPSVLGIILNFVNDENSNLINSNIQLQKDLTTAIPSDPIIGFIGAGNHASRTLIPAFKKAKATLSTLVSNTGLSASHHGNKLGFNIASSDEDAIWSNKNINTVVIATRHDSHSSLIISALKSGKHVFVEKPLALNFDDIETIDNVYRSAIKKNNNIKLMIGFNRRFAPHIKKMKSLLSSRLEPKTIIITVNAGYIPSDHWLNDPKIGGGRIIGEACHFIDLMMHLIEKRVVSKSIFSCPLEDGNDEGERVTINLSFEDGSIGTIHYFSDGSKKFPKERVEVFCGKSVLQLDNYRILKGYDWPGFKSLRLFKMNKGQDSCVKEFLSSISEGKSSPIPYEDIINSSKLSLKIKESMTAT